jgi:outer membrane murein-binding lipoprotein Lpp
MTDKNWEKMTKFIIWALIVILTIIMLSGCGTEKKLLRQKVKQDSSTITELQQEVRLSKQENSRLESELKQAQYAGVIFDSTPCPPVNPIINVDSRCNVDSVRNALQAYYGSLWQNKVKVLSDGTIEAQGRLKSATYTLLTQQRLIAAQKNTIDSFSTALAKEKKNVKTVEVVRDKWKKTSLPLWWLIVAFVAGAVVWARFGYQIRLFIKHITTKWA